MLDVMVNDTFLGLAEGAEERGRQGGKKRVEEGRWLNVRCEDGRKGNRDQ